MTASGPPNPADITSFGKVLNAQLKKPTDVPDYTLDYGYEGGNSSSEENEPGDIFEEPHRSLGSSGFHDRMSPPSQPFGDAFDALDEMPSQMHDL